MINTPSGSTCAQPVFTAFIVLTFYSVGAGYLESFVNYPLWHVIGASDEWVAYRQVLGPRVLIVLALPALASLVTNALLFFARPAPVPAWTVTATFALLLMALVSTLAIQLPIQSRLDVAYDRAAVDWLMTTSLWLRDVPGGITAGLVAYMLHRVVSTSASGARVSGHGISSGHRVGALAGRPADGGAA